MEAIVRCPEHPAEVDEAAGAERDLPGVAGEPGVLRDLGGGREAAGRGAESTDAEDEAGWVLLRVLVGAADRPALALGGDAVSASAADEAAAARAIVEAEEGGEVDGAGGRRFAIEEERAAQKIL